MIRCQDVVNELWGYLDGELPRERAAAIADHLAACARCYPHYRFEYGFLAAVARQRSPAPVPPALVAEVAEAILASTGHDPREGTARAPAATVEPRPRARPPIRPARATSTVGGRAERAAMVALRVSLGALLVMCAIRLVSPTAFAAISPPLSGAVATLEGLLAGAVLAGLWRRWSYGAALLVHTATLFLLWHAMRDAWGVAAAALPAGGLLMALYLLRHRDTWTLDAWLMWRRAGHVTG